MYIANDEMSGIVLFCDAQGKIVDLTRHQAGILDYLESGQTLSDLVHSANHVKLQNFLQTVSNEGVALNWELNVNDASEVTLLHFAGVNYSSDQVMIIIARTSNQAIKLLNAMMQLNNEQTNKLRRVIKQKTVLARQQSEKNSALYDQLSQLNNELANLQRELSKKNFELKVLNEDLTQKNIELSHFHETITALASFINPKDIYSIAFRTIAHAILGTNNFALALYDSDQAMLKWQFVILDGVESPPDTFEGFIVDTQQLETVLHHNAPLLVENKLPHPVNILCIPVFIENKLWGMIQLENIQTDLYANVGENMLSALATQTGIAIEKALLYQEVQEYAKTLEIRVEERTDKLNELNERIVTILNNVTDGITLLSHTGAIQIWNPRFVQMFGYGPEHITTMQLQQMIQPDHRDVFLAAMQYALEKRSIEQIQVECQHKDGSTFDVDLSFVSVPSSRHQLVCTIVDISHFKEIQRIKNNFINTVNHELRTPITNIGLIVHNLLTYYDRMVDESRLKKISQIDQQSQIMVELITSILNLSDLDSRQADNQTEEVDLVEITHQAISDLEVQANEKKQTISTHFGVDSIVCTLYRLDFYRIWQNLVSNAIKYTPSGGHITIELSVINTNDFPDSAISLPPDDYVIGKISDNGPGISDADQQKVFTRFFRGWAKTSITPGTGLGLSLVRETLNLYGGDIEVESTVDVGTTFTFWLPYLNLV